MPVRSLHSSILKWPDRQSVEVAARKWAEEIGQQTSHVMAIGVFGSYARGDWGVGSDLDLVVILDTSDKPFAQRPLEWDLTRLPVPAEAIVYTQAEWRSLLGQKNRFAETIAEEVNWLYSRAGALP